jgi:hypothetical protein
VNLSQDWDQTGADLATYVLWGLNNLALQMWSVHAVSYSDAANMTELVADEVGTLKRGKSRRIATRLISSAIIGLDSREKALKFAREWP